VETGQDYSIKVHFLGTAGGGVHPERFCASLAFETPDGLYVFDAGEPCASLLVRQGLEPRRIRAAFITHWHRDHVSGLMGLIGHLKHARVFVPLAERMLPMLEGAARLAYLPYQPERDVKFQSIGPGPVYDDSVIRVEAVETSHFRQLLVAEPDVAVAPGELVSLSFIIRYRGVRIVYTGDVGAANDIRPLVKEPVDLLIVEAAHILPLAEQLAFLREAPVRNIVITHIWSDVTGNHTAIAESVKEVISDHVWAAHDGMCVRIDSESPGSHLEVIPSAEVRHSARSAFLWGEQKIKALTERGVPLVWWLLGPFENPREHGDFVGLLRDYGIRTPPVGDDVFPGKGRRMLRWRRIGPEDIDLQGGVDLGLFIGGTECLAFAAAKIHVAAGKYRFLMGSDDGMRVWLDGEEIHFARGPRAAVPDQDEVLVELTEGEHDVLVAVDQHYGGWIFYLRVVPFGESSS